MPSCHKPRHRCGLRLICALILLAIGPLLAACADTNNDYEYLNAAQRAKVDALRQEFPDPVIYPQSTLVNFATAENPELFAGYSFVGDGRAHYLKWLADARAAESKQAVIAASQSKISLQATLNTPSQDSGIDPTALDTRRNEAAFGHPQF